MDEKIDQLKPHEIDEAQALYRASKLENCMNDVCRGINNYLRLYPETVSYTHLTLPTNREV